MKFITETELRDRYKKNPFETFVLEKNQRLTPGAKQFLTDFRIKMDVTVPTPVHTEVQNSEAPLKIQSINTFKQWAIELKKLSQKLLCIHEMRANELNHFAISLYLGLKLPEIKEIEKPCSMDKAIFIPLQGERTEVMLDFMEVMLKFEMIGESVENKLKEDPLLPYYHKKNYIVKTIQYILYTIWKEIFENEVKGTTSHKKDL